MGEVRIDRAETVVAGLTDVKTAVADAYRDEWGRVIATLIRLTGDWDLAEECAQEAFARALERWPSDGTPDNTGAWLTTTARNHAFNRLRRTAIETDKLKALRAMTPTDQTIVPSSGPTGDDQLSLIFTCCHPALPLEGQVALTLRALTGLTTAEIARALLVTEATMSQRLVRAKRKILEAGIPFRTPPAHLLGERTTAVAAVVYLLFNEGYTASFGKQLVRPDLCAEAIRLARRLSQLMPAHPEVRGLLALLLLQDSRRGARLDSAGEAVPLEHQDRSLWDHAEISEGIAELDLASKFAIPGPYQTQAAIAACHAVAPKSEATDWHRILSLYDQLVVQMPTPIVELNRAVAVAMAHGPAVGLRLVEELDDSQRLPDYHLLPATRADLLRRLGRLDEAARFYAAALDLAYTDTERNYLRQRLDECAGHHG